VHAAVRKPSGSSDIRDVQWFWPWVEAEIWVVSRGAGSGRQVGALKSALAVVDKYQHMHFFTFNTVLV